MGFEAPQWLDTGCGTGTLASRALEAIPDASFTLNEIGYRPLKTYEYSLPNGKKLVMLDFEYISGL